jgi:hypothetical protein
MFNQNIISNKFDLNLSTTLSSYIYFMSVSNGSEVNLPVSVFVDKYNFELHLTVDIAPTVNTHKKLSLLINETTYRYPLS